jgi:hypothetical protein
MRLAENGVTVWRSNLVQDQKIQKCVVQDQSINWDRVSILLSVIEANIGQTLD